MGAHRPRGADSLQWTAEDFALFETMLDHPPEERRAHARNLAASEAQFNAVMRLLEFADAESFLDRPAAESFASLMRPSGIEEAGLEIIRELGRGGMGIVYLAYESVLDRYVALKFIATPPGSGERDAVRWRSEARLLARLDHPRVVPVYRTGELGGSTYIVSGYVEGDTLGARIGAEFASGAGSVAWHWRSAGFLQELARAVDYAHGQGVIHRDIKPSNILIDADGHPVLVDFGIAKDLRNPAITADGERPGSVAYMSPEQRGEIDREIGPASDVYGLGLVLFECLAGERFDPRTSRADRGAPNSDDARVRLGRVRPSVPAPLIHICARALEIDPAHRYSSAGEMANDLDRASRGELAVSILSLAPIRAFWRRHRVAGAAGATAGVAALATLIATQARLPERGVLHVSAWPDRTGVPVQVRARPLDPVTLTPGDRVEFGEAPVRESLRVGPYRIEIEVSGETREFVRWIQRGERIALEPGRWGGPVTTDGMALIPAGEVTLNRDDWRPESGTYRVSIESFWIDRTEVTNAEYREFVLATGRRAPALWTTPYDPAWDRLPVVGVSLDDARAYAEWRGKRLPTYAEWLLAAAGPNDLAYPWGGSPTQSAIAEFGPGASVDVWNQKDTPIPVIREQYVALARQAGSSTVDVTPSGVSELFGNAAEWTESGASDVRVGGSGDRFAIAAGRPWSQAGIHTSTLRHALLASPESRVATIGFRCAKAGP